VAVLERASRAGTAFVFGYLGGGPPPFEVKGPGSTFVLAFQALPLILISAALSSLLYYWRVLPVIVRAFAWVLRKTLNVGGAVGVSQAVNVFVGMLEAPIFIKPYLPRLTRSELFVVMTGGMAGVAGTVLVLYASFLRGVIPDALGHLLTSSVLGAPAAVVIARLMVPETAPATPGELTGYRPAAGSMDAVAQGTADGLQMLLGVVAMLITLVALVDLANAALGLLPAWGGAPLTFQRLLGWGLAPLGWLLGLPWAEVPAAGALLGTKTILNELLAYLDLAALPPETFSLRSRLILTYALCGFANLGSLGILIGGMSALVPERRTEVVQLGLKTIIGGTLSSCLTGSIVGFFY
jgi:CNT family concentrative nucleoside transporter